MWGWYIFFLRKKQLFNLLLISGSRTPIIIIPAALFNLLLIYWFQDLVHLSSLYQQLSHHSSQCLMLKIFYKNSGKTTGYRQHNSGKTTGYRQHNSGKTTGYRQHNSGKTTGYRQHNSGKTTGYIQHKILHYLCHTYL
jgi:hypothetical protein